LSVKPNRFMDLTKTNYFANLKRKAKHVKDVKEQITVNEELLNCITILEARNAKLEAALSDLYKSHNAAMSYISKFVNEEIMPKIAIKNEENLQGKGREKIATFKNENFVEDENLEN